MSKKFDINKSDSQATAVTPVKPENFDFDEYIAYAGELDQRCKVFSKKKSGVLVYRRMRVAECFSYGCRDMEWSLNAQLGPSGDARSMPRKRCVKPIIILHR